MLKFIDTHVHFQDLKTKAVDDVIATSLKFGVEKFIAQSAKVDDWEKVSALYKKFPSHIIPAFGLHPWYCDDVDSGWEIRLRELLYKYPNAIIGEIGLDNIRGEKQQEDVFIRQLKIAKDMKRPVCIHAVKAQKWFEHNWGLVPEKAVFHSYSGKAEFLKSIVRHGAYVSFSFSILNKDDREEVINLVPEDRLLLETDSPYCKRKCDEENKPYFLPDLLREIATIKGTGEADLSERIYQNSMEFIKVGK